MSTTASTSESNSECVRVKGVETVLVGRGEVGALQLRQLEEKTGAIWRRHAMDGLGVSGQNFHCRWKVSELDKPKKGIDIIIHAPGDMERIQKHIVEEAEKHLRTLVPSVFDLNVSVDRIPPPEKLACWRSQLERRLGINIEGLSHDARTITVLSGDRLPREQVEAFILRVLGEDASFEVPFSVRPREALQLKVALRKFGEAKRVECSLRESKIASKEKQNTCEHLILVWPTPWTLSEKSEFTIAALDKKMGIVRNALCTALEPETDDDIDDDFELAHNVVLNAVPAAKKASRAKRSNEQSCSCIKQTRRERLASRIAAKEEEDVLIQGSANGIPPVRVQLGDMVTSVVERSIKKQQHAGKRQMWQRNKDKVRSNMREHKLFTQD